jgi:hypothetical protein
MNPSIAVNEYMGKMCRNEVTAKNTFMMDFTIGD